MKAFYFFVIEEDDVATVKIDTDSPGQGGVMVVGSKKGNIDLSIIFETIDQMQEFLKKVSLEESNARVAMEKKKRNNALLSS